MVGTNARQGPEEKLDEGHREVKKKRRRKKSAGWRSLDVKTVVGVWVSLRQGERWGKGAGWCVIERCKLLLVLVMGVDGRGGDEVLLSSCFASFAEETLARSNSFCGGRRQAGKPRRAPWLPLSVSLFGFYHFDVV